MRQALVILLLASGLQAQNGPFSAVSNFSAELYGTADTPPAWGYSDVAKWNITFMPPAGYAVKVLEIDGDLISWIKTLAGDPPTVPESAAGVLLGLQSTPTTPSGRCDICADLVRRLKPSGLPTTTGTTMLFIQDRVTQLQPGSRAPYHLNAVNQSLAADNKLLVTVASFLNNTGKPIHIEPTFRVKYQWEINAQ